MNDQRKCFSFFSSKKVHAPTQEEIKERRALAQKQIKQQEKEEPKLAEENVLKMKKWIEKQVVKKIKPFYEKGGYSWYFYDNDAITQMWLKCIHKNELWQGMEISISTKEYEFCQYRVVTEAKEPLSARNTKIQNFF